MKKIDLYIMNIFICYFKNLDKSEILTGIKNLYIIFKFNLHSIIF